MNLLLILFAIPLLSSAVFFLVKSKGVHILDKVGAGLSLILTLYLGSMLNETTALNFQYDWVSSLGLKFSFGIDGFRWVLLLLVAVVFFALSLAQKTLTEFTGEGNYLGLKAITQLSLVGVFLAQDVFLFYFFFELALIPVYFLAIQGSHIDARKSSFRMFVYTILGSLFMLVSFVYLYSKSQSSDIGDMAITASLLPENVQRFIFWALLFAFGIKMPIFPFHSWQANAYTDSGSTATILLSALLSKMGVFALIIILLPFSPLGVENYGSIAMTLSLVGLVYGSVIAIQQDNIKTLLAFSSFAHMGLMAAGVFTESIDGFTGASIQMFAHGIASIGLFYVADLIFKRTHTFSLKELGGLSQQAPKLVVLFMIILLSSIALPLTSGFIGEFLLLKSVFDHNTWMGVVAGITIILGAVYMLRLMQRSMFGELSHEIDDLSMEEMLVLVPLVLVLIVFGFYPAPLLEVSQSFISLLLKQPI